MANRLNYNKHTRQFNSSVPLGNESHGKFYMNKHRRATKVQMKELDRLEEELGVEFNRKGLTREWAAYYIQEGKKTLTALNSDMEE
jgi:hypothetical protein